MTYPDLDQIDTLLLDMDDTLLDLRFDNHFWIDHLPVRFSEVHNLPAEQADQNVQSSLEAAEGTMAWYCIEHWSSHFELDIMSLKQEVRHLVSHLEGSEHFLEHLEDTRMDVYLVTDAHPAVLELKHAITGVKARVHRTFCSHDFGAPKRDPDFWAKFSAEVAFDPDRTLLIDDSPHVLAQARAFGIRHQLCVDQPDSGSQRSHAHDFPLIDNLYELVDAR